MELRTNKKVFHIPKHGNTMYEFDSFDEDYIDPIDKWIENNNADIKKIKSVSYRKVKQLLEQDYGDQHDA